jgi:outer membrane receptor protein involved in Fe transport
MLKKISFNQKAALLGSTALLAVSFGATSASAQNDDEAMDLEEVVVTGSRLTKSNLSSPVPLIQIGAQEIDNRGISRLEDVLNILPSIFVAQTTEVSNGATGTATLDLRGLGTNRTLVLMDGKRLPFGSASSSAANVDFIPAQLVERVDVVTGGASATYGSDAVSGVVNFVMKRDFEGFEMDAQIGVNQNGNKNEFMEQVLSAGNLEDADGDWGGEDYFVTGLFGANLNDGRGNVTAFFSYSQQDELLGADRDTGACTLGTSSSEFSYEGIGCVGSSNFRRFFLPGGDVFQQEDGTLTPFQGGPAETYNFGERNHYQRPVERWNINASAYYEIADGIEAYTDLGFTSNRTSAQIAESASFFRAFETNCENPLLQNGLGPNGDGVGTYFDLLDCGTNLADGDDTNNDVTFTNSHRNVEGDPRISETDITTWRVIAGFRGDITDNFAFDVFAQYAATRLTDKSINDLNYQRVQQALFVIEDEDGNIVCRDSSGGCVPWNIYGRSASGESLVNDEQTSFIQGTGIVTGNTRQLVLGGTIEGDLSDYGFKLPTAENGVSALVGYEYREDSLDRVPDDVSRIPGGAGLTGTGGATLPVAGQIKVLEFFGEMELPIVQDAKFAKELGLSAGFRYSDYTTAGDDPQTRVATSNSFSTESWFIGASWTPIDDIRFRANFSRAIRAPNVFDLFVGANTGLFDLASGANGLFDPCSSAPGVDPAATAAQCANTGVTAAQYGNIVDNPAGQFNQITGGNANLVAETSDAITLGVVITPSAIPNLSVSVDYFDIKIDDAISTVPAQTTLNRCLETGDATFCDLIQRDTFGTLWLSTVAPGGAIAGVSEQNANVAQLSTSGIDLNVRYGFETNDFGSFDFDYQSTFLSKLDTVPFEGADPIECAGFYAGSCGAPNPKYRHRFLASWTMNDFAAALTWRYNGATDLDGIAGSELDEQIEARSYFDLAGTYTVNENLTLRAGINNLLGQDPPLSTNVGTGTGNNNTYPGMYDVSRYIFFGVKVSL